MCQLKTELSIIDTIVLQVAGYSAYVHVHVTNTNRLCMKATQIGVLL